MIYIDRIIENNYNNSKSKSDFKRSFNPNTLPNNTLKVVVNEVQNRINKYSTKPGNNLNKVDVDITVLKPNDKIIKKLKIDVPYVIDNGYHIPIIGNLRKEIQSQLPKELDAKTFQIKVYQDKNPIILSENKCRDELDLRIIKAIESCFSIYKFDPKKTVKVVVIKL